MDAVSEPDGYDTTTLRLSAGLYFSETLSSHVINNLKEICGLVWLHRRSCV